MKVSLFKRILFGFIVALILVIGIGAVDYITTRKLTEAYRELILSDNNLIRLENTSSLAKDMQRAHRGYLLTRDSHFLAPYDNALENLAPLKARLREGLKNSPKQMESLNKLETLLDRKVTLVDKTLFPGNDEEKVSIHTIMQGKQLMDSISKVIARMEEYENQKQFRIESKIEQRIRQNQAAILVSVITFTLILAYGMVELFRILAQRKRLYQDLSEKNQQIQDSYEELSSVNEELLTNNAQLNESNKKFEEAHRDLAIREKQLTQAEYMNKAGSFMLDLDRNVFTYSPSYAELFEIQPGEKYNSFDDFLSKIHPEDVERVRSEFGIPGDQENLQPMEFRLLINGKTKTIKSAVQVIRDDDHAVLVGSVKDITDQKIVEQEWIELNKKLQESNADLESFSYSISHDLKAPVRSIMMYANLFLEKNDLTEENKKITEVIIRKARSMSDLIEGLLQLSKFGSSSLKLQEVNMDDLVFEIIEDQKHHFPERKISFVVNPLGNIIADKALIRQVWINLIVNAIKFTSTQDEAEITITKESNDRFTEFTVRDNGIGFDQARATELFNVFKRLHNHRDISGSGVGLAIVKRIIQSHGGEIRARGEEGKGASFTFTLPVDTKKRKGLRDQLLPNVNRIT